MKKKTVFGLVLGILLIGIVSAAFIPYFGTISGTVTVKAPVFYLDGAISPNSTYHNLLIGQIPTKEDVNWSDGQQVIFKTSALNLTYFYSAMFNLIFYAKTNNPGQQVQMRIYKIANNNTDEGQICLSDSVAVTASSHYSHYNLNCSSLGKIDLSPNEGIAMEINGLSSNVSDQYSLSLGDNSRTYGATRIEVIPQ